jgi:hypothetical protein
LSAAAQEHLLHSRESDTSMISPSNLLVNNFELSKTPGNSLIHPVHYDEGGIVGKLIQHGQESGQPQEQQIPQEPPFGPARVDQEGEEDAVSSPAENNNPPSP